MESIRIKNPFPGAGCFFKEETSSTMDEARSLAQLGFPAGTTIATDSQTKGRGRLAERHWTSSVGKNILATIILSPDFSQKSGFTLLVGLALCRALEIFCLQTGKVSPEKPRIKWPNDVFISGKKVAGILCESVPEGVLVGVGINVNERNFPPDIQKKASSLALLLGVEEGTELDRWRLLELFLEQLPFAILDDDWQAEVEDHLWLRGEEVEFLEGLPSANSIVHGKLDGIARSGALLITQKGESRPREYISGELIVPGSRAS